MSELKWKWAYGPYLDPPEGQKESAIRAGYIKVVSKQDADDAIAELKAENEEIQKQTDIAWGKVYAMYDEITELKAENKRLIDCVKNALDVLNAVGPLVLQHDETCILTQGVASAVNWCKRLIDKAKAEEYK